MEEQSVVETFSGIIVYNIDLATNTQMNCRVPSPLT